MESSDLEPDAPEVLQEEAALTRVPVAIDGPVRVQALPRKAASTMTRPVTSLRAVRLLTADHYRASAVLVGDVAFRVAFGEAAAQSAASMALWPGLEPLVVTAAVEVWVSCDADGSGDPVPAQVSVVTERWAVGE